MATKRPDDQLLARCLNGFSEDERHARNHYHQKWRKAYKAYRGVLEVSSDAAAWSSRQHPPLAFQVLETMTANAVDPNPRWRVRPRARFASPADIDRYRSGARANELVLAEQVETDHFAEKQRSHALQALICGMSVRKNGWLYREGTVREQRMVPQVLETPFGSRVEVPRLSVVERKGAVRDDPFSEIVNVEDFFWHEAAKSLSDAIRVTHRCFYSFEALKDMERAGVYQNVDALKESRDQASGDRFSDVHQRDRAKDLIEVLECWIDHGRRVVTIGNRNVVLRDRENPFWFDKLDHPYPFTVASAVPDLFVVPGISIVEQIMDIQELIWTLTNQSIDNLQLLSNAIVLIKDSVDDPDAFEWAPGARWIVEDPSQVSTLQPSFSPVEASGNWLMRLKDDLQNIPGAAPTLMGQVDPSAQTATEVSLTTSLAQRRVLAMKQQFLYAQRRDGEQWIALNQQFIRRPRLVQMLGADGADMFEEIRPELLQGDFGIELDSMDESLMRQERRAEKSALFQLTVNSLGAFAAMKQADPSARIPNIKALYDDVLESYGVMGDKERYWSDAAPPPTPPQQGPSPQQIQDQGMTAPQASDQGSPSNAMSMSPVAALQRLQAASGGMVNNPV